MLTATGRNQKGIVARLTTVIAELGGDILDISQTLVGDYFTMGDVGYFDEDGYLFLTGRNAETIIAGGVNIYPQEVDNELIKHDAVADSSTVGVPHDEWGEQVKAVILLKEGFEPSDELAQDILAFARMNLPGFKVPRSVDFVRELPNQEYLITEQTIYPLWHSWTMFGLAVVCLAGEWGLRRWKGLA